jgi:hypothetical protein
MLKKMPDNLCGKIKHRDLVDFLLCLQGSEREQQTQGISVTPLGVSRKVAFAH